MQRLRSVHALAPCVAALVASVVACGPRHEAQKVATAAAAAPSEKTPSTPASAPIATAAGSMPAAALDALRRGDLTTARSALERDGDPVVQSAAAKFADGIAPRSLAIYNLRAQRLPRPPFEETLHRPVSLGNGGPPKR